MAITGETPVVLARDLDGQVGALRPEGGTTERHDLPREPGDALSVAGVTSTRDSLVALVSRAPRGGESVTDALRSTDGGASWERLATLPGDRGRYGVTGLASVDGRLVATGWQDRPDAGTQAMAWTSVDGRSWSPVPLPARFEGGYEGEDYSASAPVPAGRAARVDVTVQLRVTPAGQVEVLRTGEVHSAGPSSIPLARAHRSRWSRSGGRWRSPKRAA